MAGPIKISVLADARSASRSVTQFARDTERSVNDAADSIDRGSGSMVKSFVSRIGSLGPALMPVLGTVAAAGGGLLGAGIGAAAVAAIPLALGGGVLAAGIAAAAQDPKVQKAFEPLKAQGAAVMQKFAEPFKGPLIRAAGTFGQALTKISPFLVQMGQAIAPLVDKLAPALADMAVNAMPGLLSAVKASVPMLSGLIGYLPAIGKGFSVVMGGIVALLPYAKTIGGVLLGIGKWVADFLIPPLRTIAGMVFPAVRDAIGQVRQAFAAHEPQLRTFVSWVSTAVMWVRDKLAPVIGFLLVNNIRSSVAAIKVVIAVIAGFVSGVQAAGAKLSQLVAWFKALPGRIRGAVGDLGGLLRNAGQRVVQGFIDGVTGMFGAVRSKLSELTGMLPSWKGPASRDRRLLFGNGQLVIGGFLAGLESQYGDIRSSLGGFTSGLGASAAVTGSVSVDTAGAPAWARRLIDLLDGGLTLTLESSGSRGDDALLELIQERVRVKGGSGRVLGITS